MVVEEERYGDSGTVASAREGRMRIFIGGLGGSVTADDLKKTFSTPQLGNVDSVEIIRTKGRSIAYLDFVPVSDKGLAKLFSTYNGCMWKGGRLKLEKAKEHYLLRLKREWAEDAKLSNDSQKNKVVAVENPHPSEKLSKFLIRNSEKQIHIFFPKLRKVKALPFKGTGKHKYSFQHIEVPPLPVHFCDCEEHSAAFEPRKDIPSVNHEEDNCGVNDEELTLMDSIMSKILQREKKCTASTSRTDEFASVAYNSTGVNDGLQFDEMLADQDTDEDNLIINIVGQPKSSTQGSRAVISNQDSQASKTKSVQKVQTSQGKKLKRKERHFEDSHTNNTTQIAAEKKAKTHNSSDVFQIIPDSQPTMQRSDNPNSSNNPMRSEKSAFRNLVSDKDNASLCISDITSVTDPKAEALSKSDKSDIQCTVVEENHITEPFQPVEENKPPETVSNVPNAEISRGASWFQKSSWMQLFGSSTSTSFSISQILPPGLHVEKQEQLPPLKITDSSSPVNGNHDNIVKMEKGVCLGNVSDVDHQSNPTMKLQEGRAVNNATTSPPEKKQHPFRPKQMISSTGTSETFTFMRNASSMKEWKKTKAALSGSLMKKGNKKI